MLFHAFHATSFCQFKVVFLLSIWIFLYFPVKEPPKQTNFQHSKNTKLFQSTSNSSCVELTLCHLSIPLRAHNTKLLAPDDHRHKKHVEEESNAANTSKHAVKTESGDPRSQDENNNCGEDISYESYCDEGVTEHLQQESLDIPCKTD